MGIKENIIKVRASIEDICKKSNRNPSDVKLVAVSKYHPYEKIIQAIDAGQFLFGENRVQEAVSKFDEITQKYPNVTLHIIGSLQRNKVKDAVKIASCIESVDRLELILEIEKQCAKLEKNIDILLELHTAESSKAGFYDQNSLEEALDYMISGKTPHITPKGFMTMAPLTTDESLIRKSFVTLKECATRLSKKYASLPLKELSMGMSSDYKIAIEEGATIVRIGTAIFGQRDY